MAHIKVLFKQPRGLSQNKTIFIELIILIFFTGDYLDDYIESPGYVMATSALISYYPVSSSSECAQECSQGVSLYCRSFEFCDSTKECFLFQDRTVGTPRPRGITQCSYFTSKNSLTIPPPYTTIVHRST